jgi:hypothetical protein
MCCCITTAAPLTAAQQEGKPATDAWRKAADAERIGRYIPFNYHSLHCVIDCSAVMV